MASSMPAAPWRTGIPASFRGAEFHIDVGGKASGRRTVSHEFPERDTPFTEDMGRRARRWSITGYIIGRLDNPATANYITLRDALIAACEAYGPGSLVHPTLGATWVNCDTYSVSESRERGGMATFSMTFVEAGALNEGGAAPDLTAAATAAALGLAKTAAQSTDSAVQSSLATTGGAVTA